METIPMPKLPIFPVPGYVTKFLLDPVPCVPELVPWDEPAGNNMEVDPAVFLFLSLPYVSRHLPLTGHFNEELIKELGFDFLVGMDLRAG
ncbi:hypothetical protein ES703_55257 [subsurface metagenome]